MNDDVKALVAYRLDQARETLTVARELVASGHFRDAVNRAYYAMFYASLGLLGSRMIGTSKHSGVLAMFGKHFVKEGAFASATAGYLREAFELRQSCDYREFVEVTEEETKELIGHAEAFLEETDRVWGAMCDND